MFSKTKRIEMKRNPRPGILLDTLMAAETLSEAAKAVIIIRVRVMRFITLIRDMQAITLAFRRLLRCPTN